MDWISLMKIRVEIEITEDQLKILAGESGILREEPRKSWDMPEYKEHARYAIQRITGDWLAEKRARFGK